MRIALLALASLGLMTSALAQETRVTIHSARPFGYFVGDLIHARIEVTAPAEATFSAASLPRPGPLNVSLDLRDVSLHESRHGDVKRFDIDLVYQNFYVALDVRNIEIPPFSLRIGDETVAIPSWSVGVAPLREIAPTQQERAEDYLRPDAQAMLMDAAQAQRVALALAALSALAFAMLAWDRGLPPFHRRRERIFARLARQLASQAGSAPDPSARAQAIRSMHRALDIANGASLLSEDLSAFLVRRQEFEALHSSFERFFEGSRRAFFSDAANCDDSYSFAELVSFAQALAREERRR